MCSAGRTLRRIVATGGGRVVRRWPVGRVVVTLPSGSVLDRQRCAVLA